jgi:hypothetical protein
LLITRRSQVQILPPLPTSTCVARDQIRDQTCDQRRLSRPAAPQAERRIEICGTYCNGSGHLGRGRRVETQRSHLGLAVRSLSVTLKL